MKINWSVFLRILATSFLMPTYSVMKIMSKKNNPEQKKREQEEEKLLMRNFKIEIQSGFFSNKVKFTQREKPLTDEELELMYKDDSGYLRKEI